MQARNLLGRWYPIPPMWLEGRAWLEWAALIRDPIFTGVGVPDGQNRPVMLIPGFFAGDRSLDIMRGWLRRAGYRPLRSGIDLNVGASMALVKRIAERIRREVGDGAKAVLIGQSRGGSLAFVLAQRYPKLVEQVITLGTPLADSFDLHPTTMAAVHAVRMVYRLRRGRRYTDTAFYRELQKPAPVKVTSLYSRTDGVVHWEACLRPDVEAIDVGGSHVGMGVNPRVYREIANALKR